MTELEQESLMMFLEIRDYLTKRFVKPLDFMEFMGRLVKMIKRLEAKLGTCPTGNHFGGCDCRPAVLGRAKDWKYQKKNKRALL